MRMVSQASENWRKKVDKGDGGEHEELDIGELIYQLIKKLPKSVSTGN